VGERVGGREAWGREAGRGERVGEVEGESGGGVGMTWSMKAVLKCMNMSSVKARSTNTSRPNSGPSGFTSNAMR
jgi:hypothetical protein